jgi:hypothetical protein
MYFCTFTQFSGGEMNFVTLLALILYTNRLSSGLPNQFIVWNVGQGLWTTFSTPAECLHLDAGGEKAPLNLITEECAGKKNYALFSHWDWDHINFALKAKKRQLQNFGTGWKKTKKTAQTIT